MSPEEDGRQRAGRADVNAEQTEARSRIERSIAPLALDLLAAPGADVAPGIHRARVEPLDLGCHAPWIATAHTLIKRSVIRLKWLLLGARSLEIFREVAEDDFVERFLADEVVAEDRSARFGCATGGEDGCRTRGRVAPRRVFLA